MTNPLLSRCLGTRGLLRTLALWVVAAVAAGAPVAAQGLLVVAPHPDDDVIMASGVVRRAVQRGETVHVMYVTNGDWGGTSTGYLRQGEAVAGQAELGVAESNLVFLGYPDTSLKTIWTSYTSPSSQFTAPNGQSVTYGNRGLGGMDYHSYRFGSPAPYNRPNMIRDVADFLATHRPTHIFVTSQFDKHDDHKTTYYLIESGLAQVLPSHPGYNPTVHKTTVWPGDESWPEALDPQTYFTPIPDLSGTGLVWSKRESIDVPLSMQSTQFGGNEKYLAVSRHDSQGGTSGYIGRWIHKDEFFWTEQHTGANQPPVPHAGYDQSVPMGATVTLDGTASFDRNGDPLSYQWVQVVGPPVTLSGATTASPTFTAPTGLSRDETLSFTLVVSDGSLQSIPDGVNVVVVSGVAPPAYGPNVAPEAAVTASSDRATQEAIKAVDGVVDGYPGDATREWVTNREKAGAWISLTWQRPVNITKVTIHDRPNDSDQIIGGFLEFSDGSTSQFGPLINSGAAVEVVIPARSITWLRLVVREVSASTGRVGLAEILVFESLPSANRTPASGTDPNGGADETTVPHQKRRRSRAATGP